MSDSNFPLRPRWDWCSYAQPIEEWFPGRDEKPDSGGKGGTLDRADLGILPIHHRRPGNDPPDHGLSLIGGVSWIALIANPLILPVQSLVMILGGLAMLGGMLLPGLGHLLAMVAATFCDLYHPGRDPAS